MHLQPLYAGCERYGGEVAEDLFRRGICLPSSSSLSSGRSTYVINSVRAAAGAEPLPDPSKTEVSPSPEDSLAMSGPQNMRNALRTRTPHATLGYSCGVADRDIRSRRRVRAFLLRFDFSAAAGIPSPSCLCTCRSGFWSRLQSSASAKLDRGLWRYLSCRRSHPDCFGNLIASVVSCILIC